MSWRVAFMGSPAFAIPSLQALIEHPDVDLVSVYTQPPRPKGRGHQLSPSPIDLFVDRRVPVYYPQTLRSNEEIHRLQLQNLDLIVVAAYGLILPQSILDIPRLGCWNVHASLLPRWRGASPIHHALFYGDTVTGITIMQMEAGLDTGPMLTTLEIPISVEMTFKDLHDCLAEKGAQALKDALSKVPQKISQPEDGVTYAPKITKRDAYLDPQKETAEVLNRRILAFYPNAHLRVGDGFLKILKASVGKYDSEDPSGTWITFEKTWGITCKTGVLVPEILQKPGGKPLEAEAFFRGWYL